MSRTRWIRMALLLTLPTAIVGCSLLNTPKSQLFDGQRPYQAASVTYRIAPAGQTSAHQQVSYNATTSSTTRTTTLAIRYPHPAGKTGCARVELVVARSSPTPQAGGDKTSWLNKVRDLANANLPGVTLADGVDEAMGMDLPAAELDKLVARLQQAPATTTAATTGEAPAALVASINGNTLSVPQTRLVELDQLIARVRREGNLISQPTVPTDISVPASAVVTAAAIAPSTSSVVPAAYTAPRLERLPPVAKAQLPTR